MYPSMGIYCQCSDSLDLSLLEVHGIVCHIISMAVILGFVWIEVYDWVHK